MSDRVERPYATVRRLWPETPWLTGAVLEVPPEIARSHERPGQYVVLYPEPETKVFMAIASPPGEAQGLELLLGVAAREKLRLSEGARIEIDAPAGKGFPVELALGKDVLLFAIGSGLSAIRPLVSVIRARRAEFGRVTLYAGAHTIEDHPYRGEDRAWQQDGIEVVRAISKPWVQEVFARDPVPVANAVAFLVGTKSMIAGVTETLVAAGMPPDRIKLNW